MKYLFFFLLPLIFYSCTRDKLNIEKEKKIIKQTDIDFSNISKQKGMAAAFIEYMDSSAVLLRPGRVALEG